MVWSQEREAERPPLSVILPRLYLGAERDVTQDQLASLGISYVLSVSRCSPQPSFLPCSRYLRIPIDDSLWDDLLPWIPQALHFIDAAMSSGASVLVHCAAGISRSPALAVAYIMYSLGMDLDQAYRFVKERRPSISPNFNFLGQLQHFQGTLSQKASSRDLLLQQLDNRLLSTSGSCRNTDQEMNCHADVKQEHTETVSHTDRAHELSHSEGNQQPFLSEELRTLPVSLSQKQQVHTSQEAPAPGVHEPVRPAPKPTHLQLPSGSASLVDKRKSLSLSLTPLGINPSLPSNSSQDATGTTVTKSVPSRETGGPGSHRQVGPTHRDQSPSRSRCRRAEVQEQSLLSPFSFTLNKLLGWGERLLLGGVFVQPVRMGQPALPYRC